MEVQQLQCKLLKIISKDTFVVNSNPFKLKQFVKLESLEYHYSKLPDEQKKCECVTGNNNMLLPKLYNTLNFKNSKIVIL